MGRHRQRQAPWCGEGRVGDDLERKNAFRARDIGFALRPARPKRLFLLPSIASQRIPRGFRTPEELGDPDDATWYVEGNLDEVAIDDYAVFSMPVEDYEEYYSSAEKSYQTNAWEKLTTMLTLEGSHSVGDAGAVRPFLDDSGNVAAIVAVALVSVSVLGIFVLLLRKRKTC